MNSSISERFASAKGICGDAGDYALEYFQRIETLAVERKGHQDLVSEADRNVELLIRARLVEAFPDDAIVGEEHAPTEGSSGYTWVIDPIDGTANFVAGIPAWTVVLACVHNAETCIGVIRDPVHQETFAATLGGGAFQNEKKMSVSETAGLHEGSVGIGFSNRVRGEGMTAVVEGLIKQGGVFYRNASGALSLAYVAGGRLIGYTEEHMNAWDCLAGQLLVKEAGGVVEPQNANDMIRNGGRVVVGAPSVFESIRQISDAAYD